LEKEEREEEEEEEEEDMHHSTHHHKEHHKKKNKNSEESSKKQEKKKCKGKDCGEEDEMSSLELKQAKQKFDKLEKELKGKVKQLETEENWFVKANALLNSLKRKSFNVRLHVHDLHKDVRKLGRAKNSAEAELNRLKKSGEDAKKLMTLQTALDKLMQGADSVKSQINSLSLKKEEYLAKMEEVRQSLMTIKAQHAAQQNAAQVQVVLVPQKRCACIHLPNCIC